MLNKSHLCFNLLQPFNDAHIEYLTKIIFLLGEFCSFISVCFLSLFRVMGLKVGIRKEDLFQKKV